MIQISKEEMEWLIDNGHLQSVGGRYPELTVTNRQGSSMKKTRYVSEDVYAKLKGRDINKK